MPANDTVTLLSYKHLHNIDADFDVVALKAQDDPSLKEMADKDPEYQKFHIEYVCNYDQAIATVEKKNVISGLYWARKYCKAALKKAKSYPYKVVYTASVPAISHLAGYWIKRALGDKVTWVASMSDPLYHSPYRYDEESISEYSWIMKIGFHVYVKLFMNDKYEKLAQKYADKMLYICPEQKDFTASQYSNREELMQKGMVVPLSYIPEWDQEMLDAGNAEPVTHKPRIFTHMGRIFGIRRIDSLLEALKRLKEEYPDLSTRIQFHQYGQMIDRYQQMVKDYNLEDVFQMLPRIDHEVAKQRMIESDGLVLLDSLAPLDAKQPFFPSKAVEYMLLRKDLLIISTPMSGAWRVFTDFGYTCCCPDADQVYEQVKILMNKKSTRHDYDISGYENKEATKELKEYIESHLN